MRYLYSLLQAGDFWIFPQSSDEDLKQVIELSGLRSSIQRPYAELILAPPVVLKKIRYQTLADHVKKTFTSQARRETSAAMRLGTLGIDTPKIYTYGVNLSPIGKYQSILVMEHIPNYGTMKEIMLQNPPHERRTKLIHQLLNHLSKMIHAGIYHKDAHMDNILVGPDDRLIWIDNDIAPLKGKREMDKLLKKFLASRLFEDEERDQFFQLKTLI